MKRGLVTSALLLLLAGCNVLPPSAPAPRLHDFGIPSAVPEGGQAALPLVVDTVAAPSWLSGPAILYRDLQKAPTELQRYANNQWAAPPAELLQAGIEAQLAARNSAAAHADPRYALRLQLLRFEQVLDGGESRARAQAEAELWDRDTHRLVARRLFAESRPVAPDIHGAVTGLSDAAHALQSAMLDWSAKVLPSATEEDESP